MTRGEHRQRGSGFSLPEVLMAIFILGIGVISIAALFPAGIAQQRQAVDDTMGQTVAENALAIIRSRVDQGAFGTFEEFNQQASIFTQRGDWPWLRPAFIFPNDDYPLGAIDIFNGTMQAGASEAVAGRSTITHGIPFNTFRYGNGVAHRPEITISQQERYYPQLYVDPSQSLSAQQVPRPQYMWDCMFRRYQGRILVAVFVYRVTVAGAPTLFTQVPNGVVPPLPWVTAPPDPWDAFGIDNLTGTVDDAQVIGTPCASYDPFMPGLSWQEQGQWILDQNNNVHRVLSTFCDGGPQVVDLVRPVPAVVPVPSAYVDRTVPLVGVTNVVSDIWYIPHSVTAANGTEYRMTAVYATVRDL